VVLDRPNELEALRYHERPAHVVSHGAVVELSRMERIATGSESAPAPRDR
jgi:hypothetical protein